MNDAKGEVKLCPACAARFVCHNSGQQACWCASLPAIMPLPDGNDSKLASGCYCPLCLRRMIQEKIDHGAGLPTSNSHFPEK